MRRRDDATHMLGGKYQAGFGVEFLLARFGEVHRDAVGTAFRLSVHGLDLFLVEHVLRLEAVVRCSPVLPGNGTQIAHRCLALAGRELRYLSELQGITVTGI